VCARSPTFLFKLRDLVLDAENNLDSKLAEAIQLLAEEASPQSGSAALPAATRLVNGRLAIRVDKSTFVSSFENALLKLEKLTPHQVRCLESHCIKVVYGKRLFVLCRVLVRKC
jgi:hypothetical protein